ncbi:alpha/beta hydrolase [Amycolatopsis rhabdoformis]|uniref:Alpha/beta hydrolase n=1 Tax=Amycolatopsis rhabdoformis TaxID=1448059 RepID=A0ABZ1IHX9_9PSEU|nr:alpha/beta hydrolase [Amycolatopsis rhabdoformis]WSE33025.1 alpha/beta hydrolase [Amycolatopsis rhabdoformis]
MINARGLPESLQVPGVSHRFLDTGRLRTHVAETGAGSPVLLLHGWAKHWYTWRHVLPLLGDSHRLIAADLRGCGWTDAPKKGYRTADLVEDLRALLDALGLDRVALVGHDRGAALALQLALADPDRVSHVVALNELHPYPNLGRMVRHAWRYGWTPFVETPLLGRFVLKHVPAFTRAWLRLGVADRASMPDEAVAAYLDVLRRPEIARAGEQQMYQFAYKEFIPMLLRPETRRLRPPTLLLAGAADPFTPAAMLGDATPHAEDLRVEVVENAGHHLPEERPDLVADRIREHLKRA